MSKMIVVWLLFIAGLMVSLFPIGGIAQNKKLHSSVRADSSKNEKEAYMFYRGLEREQKSGKEFLKTSINALLFIPRTFTSGFLYSASYGVNVVGDSKIIDQVQDYLYLYEKKIGWYPALSFTSGTKTSFGANVFYRHQLFGLNVSGQYHDNEIWSSKIGLSTSFLRGNTVWKIDVNGKIKNRNDYKFYGFGANPETDLRNDFKAEAEEDFGIFGQRLGKVQLVAGMRPNSKWEFFYTSFYQTRRIFNPGSESKANINNVFNLEMLSGAQEKGQQIYNEFSFRYDSRKYRNQISPGFRFEAYTGLSLGVGNDDGRFSRAGLDVAFYVPVIKENRLIVPRIILDGVTNLKDEAPISFVEYPRQLAFRGISSVYLLRTDNISVVPSIEYQWPLTYNLGGHLFLDYLLVADSFQNLTIANAPYAYGFGLDLQVVGRELGRISIANGSEGLRFKLTVGLSNHTSDRTKWQ